MKKILFLTFFLLASCAPAVSIPVFEYNDKCPHICWLGINPGITTALEARNILTGSNEVDQGSYVEDKFGFVAEWYFNPDRSRTNHAGIVIENDVVQYINLGFAANFKLQELVDLIGEPEEISVNQRDWAEGLNTEYTLYYISKKIIVFVLFSDPNGPSLNDYVQYVYLNVEPNFPNAPQWLIDHKNLRQPWLDFGHLNDYLTNRPLPPQ